VTTPGPMPSRLHVALSIVVIVECLFLFSAGVACLTVTWDPCAMFSGLMIAPLPGFLGFAQYAATFQRRAVAARRASTCAFILGGFVGFVLVVTLMQSVAKSVFPPISFVLIFAAFTVPNLWNGFLNLRWHRQLTISRYRPVDSRFRLSLRELLGFTAVIAAFLALTLSFVRDQSPQFAVNVSPSEANLDLPVNAANVSLCHGVRGTIAYEFDTDEQSFRQWVDDGIGSLESQRANIELAPIKGDYTMSRYYGLSSQLAGPDSVTIHDGLYYEWSFEDRGVYAAFDRATGRAYYYAHFH
jgi:hypothetical protein